jgi:hypothetical protein
MALEIRPEPTPEEAAAIEAALRKLELDEQGRNGHGPWWEAGVAENLDVSDGSARVVGRED